MDGGAGRRGRRGFENEVDKCLKTRSTRCYEETLERTNGGAPRCDANRGKVSEGERWSGDAPRCDAGDSKVRFGG